MQSGSFYAKEKGFLTNRIVAFNVRFVSVSVFSSLGCGYMGNQRETARAQQMEVIYVR